MKNISQAIRTFYKYNGKFYSPSKRTQFKLGDIFVDFRDGNMKIIETDADLIDVSYMAPEMYFIIEESTIQN